MKIKQPSGLYYPRCYECGSWKEFVVGFGEFSDHTLCFVCTEKAMALFNTEAIRLFTIEQKTKDAQ